MSRRDASSACSAACSRMARGSSTRLSFTAAQRQAVRVVGTHPERGEDLEFLMARRILQQNETAPLGWGVAHQPGPRRLRQPAASVAPVPENVLADVERKPVHVYMLQRGQRRLEIAGHLMLARQQQSLACGEVFLSADSVLQT